MGRMVIMGGGALVAALAIGCGEVSVEPDAPAGLAASFCADYEAACGFGNDLGGTPYTDDADCKARFESYNAARQDCVREHVAFASEGDPQVHCPHAEGAEPCDLASTFCTQYSIICEFNNDLGGTPYTDLDDCRTQFDSYRAERKECVQEHLGFAEEGDPQIHCPHVEGAAPCD